MIRNNYKHMQAKRFMHNKRGQIAIFVIVAIIIVAIILLLIFYPKLPSLTQGADVSPVPFLKSCIEPDLKTEMSRLSNNGGYANPDAFLQYQGEKIEYLCYTSENYKTCIVQQPLIKEHFERELDSLLKGKVNACLQSLEQEYEKRGYSVTLGNPDSKTSINPGNVLISITSPLTASKAGSTKSFNGFNVEIDSKMYDLLMISVSIIDYESTLGDSETTLYLQYYPDLKIEKTKLDEGSKVYRLTNVVTGESFRFASRSLVWPPGYPE